MIRKLSFLLGATVGALIVWAFTHEARKVFEREKEVRRKLAPYAKASQRRLAMKSAIDGVDYMDEAHWREELKELFADEDPENPSDEY